VPVEDPGAQHRAGLGELRRSFTPATTSSSTTTAPPAARRQRLDDVGEVLLALVVVGRQ
jgi:hypothetical protein